MQEQLDVRLLIDFTRQAREIGYNVISMSGGEPFLYRHLEEFMVSTKSLGYFNSVTTNGMLLSSERAKRIMKQLDLIAVSVDGKESDHDHMRNQTGAYKKMLAGIDILKTSTLKFGIIHTLLPGSWKILPWLAEFAISHRASSSTRDVRKGK